MTCEIWICEMLCFGVGMAICGWVWLRGEGMGRGSCSKG
jgi:hypothetical protein